MSVSRLIIYIVIMALVTYVPRVLPVTLFRHQIKSRFVKSFLDYTPYAVLGALTFPDIFTSTGSMISAAAGTVAALVMAYFDRSLVEVAVTAVAVVYIVELIL